MIEQRLIVDQRSAYMASCELYEITKARPGRYLMRLVELDREWRAELRGAYHGDVLRDIAEQAHVPQQDGRLGRCTKAMWKELFKDWFLPDGITSTEDLTDEEFGEFVLQTCAFAAIELGVVFTDRECQ